MTLSRIPVSILIATTLAAATTSAMAGKLLQPPGASLKVVKAQLAIKSPNADVCPAGAKMTGWIFTNKPGKFEYMIAKKGGKVSGPFPILSKTGANGLHMASFSRNFLVHQNIDAEYRILVASRYGKTLSNWAPLRATC